LLEPVVPVLILGTVSMLEAELFAQTWRADQRFVEDRAAESPFEEVVDDAIRE
jgi:hypothetical protein